MNRIFLDFKRLILGQDGSENTPADFKEEIKASVNSSIIDKARAALLMTARNNVDKFGKEIDKKQIADVSGKGQRVTKEQAERVVQEEQKVQKKEQVKRKEEREEKRKKEESLRQTLQRIAEQDEKAENNIRHRQKRRRLSKIKRWKCIPPFLPVRCVYITNLVLCKYKNIL